MRLADGRTYGVHRVRVKAVSTHRQLQGAHSARAYAYTYAAYQRVGNVASRGTACRNKPSHPEVGLNEGPQHVELLVRAALQDRLLQAQRRGLRRLRVHSQVLGIAQAEPREVLHLELKRQKVRAD